MNFKSIIKMSVLMMLFSAFLAGCGSSGSGNIEINTETGTEAVVETDAEAKEESDSEQEEVSVFLKGYFSELLDTIRADSEKDYTHEDFSSVKGYIVAKQLVNTRQIYEKLLGGIEEVELKEVSMEGISSGEDITETKAYIKYSYTYPGEEEECSVGALYKVTLSKTDGGYDVLDLDCDDKETMMAKEEILGDSDLRKEIKAQSDLVNSDSELDYAVADAYFEKLEKNTESLN